jgi:hypothetical protein
LTSLIRRFAKINNIQADFRVISMQLNKRSGFAQAIVLFSIFLFILAPAAYSQKGQLSPVGEKLKQYITYLASDELEGRFPGTNGNTLAAEFIIKQLKSFNVQPINGKYEQFFPFEAGIKTTPKDEVSFDVIIEKPGIPRDQIKPLKKKWNTGEDWMPISFSSNGTVSAEMVFAGYGITSKDLNYDDYAGIDVKGKAVIVLADSAEGEPKYKDFTKYSDMRYKATNARDHGAVAIIFVKTLSDSANKFFPLKVERMYKHSDMVAIQVTRTSISKFFPTGNKALYTVELGMTKTHEPNSFTIPNAKINITTELTSDITQVPNVIGMVKGTDPVLSNEYIVIGAHFDHLGWGGENSLYRGKKPMIHHGADDNASGTSAMMELASRIAAKPLKRSVIFISFNCEEEGLYGSSNFVKDPPVPLDKIDFMLNLDMVGRMKERKLSILGAHSSTNFEKLADSLAALDTLQITVVKESYGPSDHASFFAKGVPVLMLFTDLHADYHRPSDVVDKINFPGMERVINYGEQIARTIGDASTKPDYIKTAEPVDSAEKVRPKGKGAWFGIVPNFEDNPKGFEITGTSPGSPAEKAGLKAGDIITSFDGKAIKNLYDLSFAIRDHNPGDVVKVALIRNNKEMTFDVTLEKK